MDSQVIQQYWQQYRNSSVWDGDEVYVADGFGDRPQMADELGQLVVAGLKTATCSVLWEWEAEGEALPKVGSKTIVLDGQQEPLCIIQTYDVRIVSFNDVDSQFAYDEGEGDRTLTSWRIEHWNYWARVLPAIGREPTQTMPLVCERFHKIYPSRQDSIRLL